ncbi:MAG TPA: TRL domain-containing protein [Planctomycetota bacterium]|nr:TRL domain-containing protein [Planctomycetota bacterium]
MRRIIAMSALVGIMALCLGCANGPILGWIQATKGPVCLVDLNAKSEAIGRSECIGIIGIGVGDASIDSAVRNGRIKKVNRIESEQFNVLCIFSRYQTVVYGE